MDKLRRWLKPGDLKRTLFWAALIGVVGGLCAAAFRQAIFLCQFVLTGHTGGLVGISRSLQSWQRLLIPALGGITAGLILHFGRRLITHDRPSDYMEALTVADGEIPVGPSLLRSASSLMTIASGGSIGREGSMVQLAAVAASWLSRRLGTSGPSLRLLTACGAAAGLASVYDAPIAGALFVAEIILGSLAIESLSPLLLASAAATIVSRYVGSSETYFRVPSLELISLWEILPYLAMGVGLGVLAPGYVWLLRISRAAFARMHAPIYVRLGIGGSAVGVISVFVPEVWGNGRSMVNALLTSHWLWGALILLLLCKLAATTATIGSGAVGGVFTPTLLMGAILGNLAGTGVELLLPARTGGAPAFALVAMGGFLAATTGAPMTAMLMLFEMTLDHDIVLPLIITSVTAAVVARRLSRMTLYSDALTVPKM